MQKKTLVLIGFLLISIAAVAQERLDGSNVLHEFFTGRLSAGGKTGGDAKPPEMVPVAQATSPPPLTSEAGAGELVYTPDGPLSDGRLKEPYGDLSPFGGPNTLDEDTDRVDSLTYFSNFDPSVIPYKRVVSQNSVFVDDKGDYVVRRIGNPRALTQERELPENAQVFWGTFLLQMDPNRMQPIASVAPNQQILDVQTEPAVDAQFFVDDAGNFMVRAQHAGPLRLNMKVAVPSTYFTGDFGPTSWAEIDGYGTEPLDPIIQASAERVLDRIGLGRNQAPEDVLVELISYFRNFEGRPFPEDQRGDDLYFSIATQQIGVCRHRSLAFMITALSLGIPTQYVYNEAHAFVEVLWPGMGWRRVDLGGAANELNAASTQDKTVHSPPDSLPRPERFVQDQERMVSNGLKPEGPGQGPGQNSGESTSADSSNGTNGAANATTSNASTEPEVDRRIVPSLILLSVESEVHRGKGLEVRGRLSARGAGLEGRTVSVHLAPPGTLSGSRATILGEFVTGPGGIIQGSIDVPANQPVGRWSLFLVFPGDETYAPGFAE